MHKRHLLYYKAAHLALIKRLNYLTDSGNLMLIQKSKYSDFLILYILILLIGIQNQLKAQDDDIYFESLAPELGLSQITVSSIYQDK